MMWEASDGIDIDEACNALARSKWCSVCQDSTARHGSGMSGNLLHLHHDSRLVHLQVISPLVESELAGLEVA